MRAFIIFALLVSMAFVATLAEKGGQDSDRQYHYGKRWKRETETDTLRIGKNDIENPRYKGRDVIGEVRHDATGEVREDTNQDGGTDRQWGHSRSEDLRAGKGM